MNSIGPECNDLKKEYDACFNVWYSESFLKGEYKSDPCGELLKSYRSCVLVSFLIICSGKSFEWKFLFQDSFYTKILSADLPSVVKFKIRAPDWSSVQKYQHK